MGNWKDTGFRSWGLFGDEVRFLRLLRRGGCNGAVSEPIVCAQVAMQLMHPLVIVGVYMCLIKLVLSIFVWNFISCEVSAFSSASCEKLIGEEGFPCLLTIPLTSKCRRRAFGFLFGLSLCFWLNCVLWVSVYFAFQSCLLFPLLSFVRLCVWWCAGVV